MFGVPIHRLRDARFRGGDPDIALAYMRILRTAISAVVYDGAGILAQFGVEHVGTLRTEFHG